MLPLGHPEGLNAQYQIRLSGVMEKKCHKSFGSASFNNCDLS